MDAELLARIPARMKAFAEKGTIPGAVTLVQRHGTLASIEHLTGCVKNGGNSNPRPMG
jgi:hypothetical protein